MAVSLSLSITQKSQNILNNTSTVDVAITVRWTYGSWNADADSGYCIVDGTRYNFTASFNAGRAETGSSILWSKSGIVINHNDDGTKTVKANCSYFTDTGSGTQTASTSKALTTIPRASHFGTITGDTLGQSITVNIVKADSSLNFTHKLFGKVEGSPYYGLGENIGTQRVFTPSIDLCSFVPNDTKGLMTLKLQTFSGSQQIGADVTTSFYVNVPASVVPTVSLEVEDGKGYAPTFGYVQGQSTIHAAITSSGAYGSTIKSIATVANGATYGDAEFTTGVIVASGQQAVTVTVADSRGRTATASQTINVVEYNQPQVTAMTVHRCDASGEEDFLGSYAKVTYSHVITPLSNKNAKHVYIEYKKPRETEWHSVSGVVQEYSSSGRSVVFPADDGSTYDIRVGVKDSFISDPAYKTAQLSTARVPVHYGVDGNSIAFGKVSERPGYHEIAMNTAFYQPPVFTDPTLEDHEMPYIVEQTLADTGWSHVKWSNGLQQAWYRSPEAVSVNTATAYGNLYFVSVNGIEVPLTWAAKPMVQFDIRCAVGLMGANIKGEYLTNGVYSFDAYVWASNSGSRDVYYDIMVIGRWK